MLSLSHGDRHRKQHVLGVLAIELRRRVGGCSSGSISPPPKEAGIDVKILRLEQGHFGCVDLQKNHFIIKPHDHVTHVTYFFLGSDVRVQGRRIA